MKRGSLALALVALLALAIPCPAQPTLAADKVAAEVDRAVAALKAGDVDQRIEAARQLYYLAKKVRKETGKPFEPAQADRILGALREAAETSEGYGPMNLMRFISAHVEGASEPQLGELVKWLDALVRGNPKHLRWPAIEVLGELGPAATPAVPALADFLKQPLDNGQYRSLFDVIAKIGPGANAAVPAIRQVIANVKDQVDVGDGFRYPDAAAANVRLAGYAALDALGAFTEDDVKPLGCAMAGASSRFYVMSGVGILSRRDKLPPEIAPDLVASLGPDWVTGGHPPYDQDPKLHALVARMGESAVEPLCEFIRKRNTPDSLAWCDDAMQVLRALGPKAKAAAPLLVSLLKQEGTHEPRAAWQTVPSGPWVGTTLGAIGEDAVEPVAALLKDGSPQVRALAAWTLSRTGAKSALPHLAAALNDPDPKVRDEARKALDALQPPAAKPAGDARRVGAWSEEANGLQSRIILDRATFKAGERIDVRVEVENVGDKPAAVTRAPSESGESLTEPPRAFEVTTPGGRPAVDISHWFQTGSTIDTDEMKKRGPPPQPMIDAGKTIVFTAGLEDYYYMGRPGRYAIRWKGEPAALSARDAWEEEINDFDWDPVKREPVKHERPKPSVPALPAAPAVEIEVAPGAPDPIGPLLDALPPGWRLGLTYTRSRPSIGFGPRGEVQPPGRKSGKGTGLTLTHFPVEGMLQNVTGFWVYIMDAPAEPKPEAGEKPALDLGKGRFGHIYLGLREDRDTPSPEARWHRLRYDVASALGVTDPAPAKLAGPDWGRMMCAILKGRADELQTRDQMWLYEGSIAIRGPEGQDLIAELSFAHNAKAVETMKAAWTRDNPDKPYYHVSVRVVPLPPGEGQAASVAIDRSLNRTTGPRVPAYDVKRLGVRLYITVESDDDAFRKAFGAILDREITRVLADAPAATPAARRVHVFVSGRVQGVGFRAFVKARAKELQLTGWVKNLADGRVEAVIEGPPGNVAALIEKLKRGPTAAKVDKAEVADEKPTGEFKDFEVRYE